MLESQLDQERNRSKQKVQSIRTQIPFSPLRPLSALLRQARITVQQAETEMALNETRKEVTPAIITAF